jgi:hypothetical protein
MRPAPVTILRFGLPLAVLLAMVGSGCLGSGLSGDMQAYVFGEPRGFMVEASTPGGNIRITFSGPVEVVHANRSPVTAYVLTEESLGPESDVETVYYLDVNYRIIAVHLVCQFGHDCSQYTTWLWLRQGDLAPYGLGYPDHIRAGGLETWEVKRPQEIPWESEILDDGRLELLVKHPFRSERTYWYTPGRPLPDSTILNVTSFGWHDPLAEADSLETRSAPPVSPWQDFLFEGENEDHFEVGATHLEIVRSAVPELGKSDSVCVPEYGIKRSRDANRPPGPLEVTWTRHTASAFGTRLEDGELRSFSVAVEVHGSVTSPNTTSMRVSWDPQVVEVPWDCEDVRRAPWPGISLSAGLDFASTMNVSGSLEGFRSYALPPDLRPMEVGVHQWYVDYRPDHVQSDGSTIYLPYSVGFEPHGEMPLWAVTLHPDDDSLSR